MEKLSYDENTELFVVEGESKEFATASEALWSAFFSRTSFEIFVSHALTKIVLERAANNDQPAQGKGNLAGLLRMHFFGYLRAVCLADDEEAEETCSMIDFEAQAKAVWDSALLKLNA